MQGLQQFQIDYYKKEIDSMLDTNDQLRQELLELRKLFLSEIYARDKTIARLRAKLVKAGIDPDAD